MERKATNFSTQSTWIVQSLFVLISLCFALSKQLSRKRLWWDPITISPHTSMHACWNVTLLYTSGTPLKLKRLQLFTIWLQSRSSLLARFFNSYPSHSHVTSRSAHRMLCCLKFSIIYSFSMLETFGSSLHANRRAGDLEFPLSLTMHVIFAP